VKKEIDYYIEKDKIVLTEQFLIKRGKCCGGSCRHCPFTPPYVRGNKDIKDGN